MNNDKVRSTKFQKIQEMEKVMEKDRRRQRVKFAL